MTVLTIIKDNNNEIQPVDKKCIKCDVSKDCNQYNNRHRPNICSPCLKIDAKEKYIKNKNKNKDKDIVKIKKVVIPEEKVPLTLQRRSNDNNEILETKEFMISKKKRDKILKLLS